MLIVPSKNPLTNYINGLMVDASLKHLIENYLPAWDIKITSGYRSQADQLDLISRGYNAAKDSSHLYNLARDFILINKTTGNTASDSEMQKIYEQFIKPYWIGYSKFTAKQSHTVSGWIHVNLDRDISQKNKILGIGIVGIISVGGIYKLLKQLGVIK